MSSTVTLSPTKRAVCQARLSAGGEEHTLAVLIDSGSDINIMDEALVQQLGIRCRPLSNPVPANALDGRLLGHVAQRSAPVHMLLAGNHHETVQFNILRTPRHPLVLGYPWLRRHNPHIDWTSGVILSWSPTCHQVCLKEASPDTASVISAAPPDLAGVPEEYHDLREVFSKPKATSLLPH